MRVRSSVIRVRHYLGLTLLLSLVFSPFTSGQTAKPLSEAYKARQKRTEWFSDARFGMFIHWGIYAVPARGEWVRQRERMPVEKYQDYFNEFNPMRYDARQWARVAREAGMKYAVITAKHHDGFCLFDSQFTDYKATNTPAGRDLIKEFVEAFRAEGLRVGFYYSLLDWHHPDYPHYSDSIHPMRGNETYQEKKHDFDNYLKYMHSQVRELLTNYGRIDIMWFDFSYGEMSGEKWRATELVKMVRELQPEIIIDNRLGGNMERREPEFFAGDFEGPEQVLPPRGVFDEDGNRIPWELCLTLNNQWGYAANDFAYKSPAHVIRTLVNCVSKGGNLLLNVGPTAWGEIPPESVEVLAEVGKWLKRNGESIYGCGAADVPKPQWGYYTRKGNSLYAHVVEQPIGQLCLEGLKGKIESARLVRDGSEVFVADFWHGERSYIGPDDTFLNFGRPLQHTFLLPDPVNTVVELRLE
jgi:alpha-L-fucosidase